MIERFRFSERCLVICTVVFCLVCQNLSLCWSLNDEGLALLRFRDRVVSDPFGALSNWNDDVGVIDPCLWHGIKCSEGNVVVLILRNNSFCGIIPEEIGELEELEVLDLGCNNFSGPLPSDLGNNLSLSILLLDNNELFSSISPELDELKMLSEVQVDENHLSYDPQRSLNVAQTGHDGQQRLLTTTHPASTRKLNFVRKPERNAPFPSPPPLLSTSALLSAESPSRFISPFPYPAASSAPYPILTSPSPAVSGSVPLSSAPVSSPLRSPSESSERQNHRVLAISVATGVSVLLVLIAGVFFCQRSKVVTVKPWATGLSGQLQKAFVTGVPKLKRSELETACEDFSNVISSSSVGTVYKGTLSSGVEIAVASIAVTSVKDWSKNLETQFRKKIDLLSKVNHKNFVNLIGYCEEEEPFTRMMVFEYAPNGTLFEHLHIKEAEHLDWGMRMRIIMGMAYCLEHMHQSTPPIAHKHLNSSAVHLTEDYAAKLSDFGLWNEIAAIDIEESCSESNIYAFGVLLFEMITGRLPYSVDSGSFNDWASDYLSGKQPLREMVDPTLNSFQAEQLKKIGEVIKSCVHPDLRLRPGMNEVTARLREITYIGPDAAIPKLSPLWWAELEILSTAEAN
ncbi:hypothetical protein RJ639_001182 [Escallonia herrerae]|uniref:Protein kinase domain-containing protein n=1 Tax=Escallonia herrerae TaxID=1293975 RepID=A0AA88XAV7_9ASTE|nr:hypothetical protein RJ639_001182 [Escallonia herrerae]